MIQMCGGEWRFGLCALEYGKDTDSEGDFVIRGAVVKAMAICTRHPFIQIFKVRIPLPLPN